MNIRRGWSCSVVFIVASVFVLAACGAADTADVLQRARAFTRTPDAREAAVTLEMNILSSTPLSGSFYAGDSDHVRYFISNDTFRLDLEQSGRQAWLVMAGAAVHLSPEDLSDTEYDRLRLMLGPGGLPLVSMPDLLNLLEKNYTWAGIRRGGMFSGSDFLIATPNPAFRSMIRAWVTVQQSGSSPHIDALTPDTVYLGVSRRSGQIVEVRQVSGAGNVLSKLTFDFSRTSESPPPSFRRPSASSVLTTRELMMAMGAPPQWLIGKSVPEGTLQTLDGRMRLLSDFQGKPMMINFWATWCMPCIVEWPVFEDLHARYGDRMAFILLSDESDATVRSFVQGRGYRTPTYLLRDERMRWSFGVTGFPTTFFVDSKGVIRDVSVGVPPRQTITEAQRDLRDKYTRVIEELF